MAQGVLLFLALVCASVRLSPFFPVPLFWTCSHLSWGWGQVSSQSADAQEQVEGLLAENSALRTSLAALEQVQDTWGPSRISPCFFCLSRFWSMSGQSDLDP